MKSLDFFGHNLNGLEFTTYVLAPSSILLIVLVYLYFNYKVILFSLKLDNIDVVMNIDLFSAYSKKKSS